MNTQTTLGQSAPTFVLSALDGTQHALATLTGKPLVVEFGSFTSPDFRETHPALERLLSPHAADINFVVIYGPEAHPSDGQQVAMNVRDDVLHSQPTNMAERMAVAKIATKTLNIQTLLLVDDMQNSTTIDWNGTQNTTIIVNPDGTIHSRMATTDLSLIRAYIEAR
jgi:thyroxine 5-deiodinase